MTSLTDMPADIVEAEDVTESMFSVCYRTNKPTIADYDEAIKDLENAKTDLRWKRDGFGIPTCFVCEDGGHTAATCHHNPLLLSRQWAKATEVWQCWHCGFIATNEQEAVDHFGKTEDEVANCLRGWQPIETAPKDGTKILLIGGCYHGMPFAGCWELSPYSPDLPWKNLINDHRLYEHCATHWQPLPSPPKGS